MKRADISISERPTKRKTNRPFNITLKDENGSNEKALLGSKTKGHVYLRDKQKEKQRYEDFNYGNYHSYYS